MSNSVVLTSMDENQSQAESFDIHLALVELEKSLMYSVDQLAPAIEAISAQLNRAASNIREAGDAAILWTCLDNLQHFLKLLETITVTAGIPQEDIAAFDEALSDSLTELEERMNQATCAEDIAVAIEVALLPALTTWSGCEAAVRRIIERDPNTPLADEYGGT